VFVLPVPRLELKVEWEEESQGKPLDSSFSAVKRVLYRDGHNRFSLVSEGSVSPVGVGEGG
jgi:hypothetical protein